MLIDSASRTIRYLRLSLTDACPMRCVYCRPSVLCESEPPDRLTPEELETLVTHLVTRHGLRKVRLTGGEPTARRSIIDIIARLAAVPGLRELTMTTNGLTLARQAHALREAGLHRVNVSLDSLDPNRFNRLTGVDGLQRVIEGIDAAIEARLEPVKLNAVILRGENDADLPDLLNFAVERGLTIRFIELMPMGPLADHWAERYITASQMRRRLDRTVEQWSPLPRGSEAAETYSVRLRDGRYGTVGFITPMSCSFCDGCDRLRIACDGTLYPCLMDAPASSIRPALRPAYDPKRLDDILSAGLERKAPVHPAVGIGTMTRIGG